jgi:serine/threonine protein kinase
MEKWKVHQINGHEFHLPTRFKPKRVVGQGSYGVVCAAVDSRSGTKVAVKRIKPAAGDAWDARHALREVRLMRLLAPHPNVISLVHLAHRDAANKTTGRSS